MRGRGGISIGQRSLWWGGVILLAVLAVWGTNSTYQVYRAYAESAVLLADARSGLTAAQNQHQALSAKVEALGTERGVEDVIRAKFGLVREGEHEYILMDGGLDTSTDGPPSFGDFMSRIWAWFGM